MSEEGKDFAKAKNCWEMRNCPEDRKEKCPAHPDMGKFCWNVEGTLCDGVVQGKFHVKAPVCKACEYYKYRNE